MKTAYNPFAASIICFALLAIPVLVFAQEEDADEDMSGKLNARIVERLDQRFARMAESLSLSPEQSRLLDEWKSATRSHVSYQRTARQKNRELFNEELGKPAPNFTQTATTIKGEYRKLVEGSFNAMIDAEKNFYQSLSKEQREKIAGLKNMRNRKFQGQGPRSK